MPYDQSEGGCEKRAFQTKADARDSVKHMHQTVRVYRCEECHMLHVTKSREKNKDDLGRKRNAARKRSMIEWDDKGRRGGGFAADDYPG